MAFDDVLREELIKVKLRRKVLFPRIVDSIFHKKPEEIRVFEPDPDPPARQEKGSDVAVTEQRENALDEDLAGLAFSGGGIRSASFAIGVLQGLASLKLLNWFDYLSTVSGGGYAGGWLAAWLKREGNPINVERQLEVNRIRQSRADRHFAEDPHANPPEWKPLSKTNVLDEEPEPVRHLRAYSSYLTPRGGLFSTDTWTVLAIYLRNVFINLLVLLPLLFFVVISVRLIITCTPMIAAIKEVHVWSLDAVPEVFLWGQSFLFWVYIVGVAFGFFGLAINSGAIWGLRTSTNSRVFLVRPGLLSWGVILPLIVAASLVALSYQGAWPNVIQRLVGSVLYRRGLIQTAPGREISNATFLSTSCIVSHFLIFAIPLGIIQLLTSLWRHSGLGWMEWGGAVWKETWSAICGGLAVGTLIAVTYELLRFTDQQPWLRATIGPPLFLVNIVLGFTVLIALLGSRINELEREWWGRLAGRLLLVAFYWLILFGVIVYGPSVVKGLGAVAKTVLAAIWVAITSGGVWAGQRQNRHWSGAVVPGVAVQPGTAGLPGWLVDGAFPRHDSLVGLVVPFEGRVFLRGLEGEQSRRAIGNRKYLN